MTPKLANKVVIVTGGASGIGQACVLRFLKEGAKVVIADINEVSAHHTTTIARDQGNGNSVAFKKCDVSIEDDIASLIKFTRKKYGRLDCLFNNAGSIGAMGTIVQTETEEWDKSFQIIVRGAMLGIKHAAPVMSGGGTIINTASIAGLSGGVAGAAYTAAKAALLGLTKRAAVELASARIRVNAICPGFILTPMISVAEKQEMEAVLNRSQPWPEAGTVEDIAGTALFLASEDSRFVTGESIVVDGGKIANGPGVFDNGDPLGQMLMGSAKKNSVIETGASREAAPVFTDADWE